MDQNQLKQAVAQAAVEYCLTKIQADSIVGIGTGSTANCFIDQIAEHKHLFAGTVASSEGSAERLRSHGIDVFDLNQVDEVTIYIDGADEANPKLELIKGGGAALTREKIVTAVAKEFVCIADESKWVDSLGTFPLPVDVITDNGNIILDVHHLYPMASSCNIEEKINHITGVVTNGLFALKPADILFLATQQGIVSHRA